MRKSGKVVIAAIVAVALLAATVSCAVLYGQNRQLRKRLLNTVDSEWNQLYWMGEQVERHVLSQNLEAGEFRLYVNQSCYYGYTMGGNSALAYILHDWLALSYDQVFMHYASATDPVIREAAFELLADMNAELLSVSRAVRELDADKRAALLDEKSEQYIELYDKVALAEQTYREKATEFFKFFSD